MSIQATFWVYNGDPRKANKTLTNSKTITTIHPLEALSDLDIKLILDYDTELMSKNYVQIGNDYYQVTSRERLTAQAMAVYATLDGVLSYWGEIVTCPCVIERSSSAYNLSYNDPKYKFYQDKFYETKDVGSLCVFGDFAIIMGYAGGRPQTKDKQYVTNPLWGEGSRYSEN